MFVNPSPWADLLALPNVRPYQLHALEALQERYRAGERQVCLVAPPGAGKTLCALLTAVALDRIVDVCVPTTALVEQWEAAVCRAFETLVEEAVTPVSITTYAGLKGFRPDALVILDEAHHVQAKWGETVQKLLGKGNLLLGLTATPPLPEREAQRFFDLVGNDPVVIDAPPLVRDSHLAPYLEFVWPVLVDVDDAPLLREADRQLHALEEAHRPALTDWMRRELQEHLWEMTEDRFASRQHLLVSLCRTHRALGGELPLDLPPDAELLAPPTLLDRAVVLAAMTNNHAQMIAALKKAGFSRSGEQIVMRQDLGLGQLTQTRARLRGAMEVLLHEWRVCGDSLRALVLTDRDVEGERLSSREILKALVSDPQTDALDPIMVTGSCFWVDDDLWPRIAAKMPDLPWQNAGGHHEIDVTGWEVKKRVALATQLLQSGATHCLVGTLHLLGEGWDCPAVNCLVDLTGIAAQVSVGQMRGRALRLDPQDPAKVASLWEVVALLPGVSGGERMLEQSRLRHTHTFGLDGVGNIRSGIERIDPILAGDVANVAAASDTLRHNMQERLENWPVAKKRWQVGKEYLDQHRWQVEKLSDVTARPVKLVLNTYTVAADSNSVAVQWKRRRILRGVLGSGSLSLVAGAAVYLGIPMPVVAGLGMSGFGLLGWTLASGWRKDHLERALRASMLRCLHEALTEIGQVSGQLVMDEKTASIADDSAGSRHFAEAAQELLGPVRYPRYLLLDWRQTAWSVPSALGVSKGSATRFARGWARHVSACQIVYARQGEGKALLIEAWKNNRGLEVPLLVEYWE
ncbi:MAG: helicase conserved C-terminal domain protein [Proteobacteria bacterium]|nr:helicase conserved C-terminal domain protein [Pseudomonadota bacterium]